MIYIQTIISNFWMTYSWIILPVYHKLWVWWKRLSVSHLWKIVNNFQLSFINFSYKNLQSTRCSFVLFCLFMEKKIINRTNDVTSDYYLFFCTSLASKSCLYFFLFLSMKFWNRLLFNFTGKHDIEHVISQIVTMETNAWLTDYTKISGFLIWNLINVQV